MALDSSQRERIASLLSTGMSAADVASDIGCSIRTVERIRKKIKQSVARDKRDKSDKAVHATTSVASAAVMGVIAPDTLDKFRDAVNSFSANEGELIKGGWELRQMMHDLTFEVMERMEPESISPKQIPSLVRALIDLNDACIQWSEHAGGLDIIGKAIANAEQ